VAVKARATASIDRRGIEILARSIYRDLRARGGDRCDVVRLATALLDQVLAGPRPR
jgi:hypothetical protein